LTGRRIEADPRRGELRERVAPGADGPPGRGAASDAASGPSDAAVPTQHDELDALYASAPFGFALFDRGMRYLRINERLAEMNGAPAAAHLGRTASEMVPDLGARAEAIGAQLFAGGAPVRGLELVGETPARPGVRRAWSTDWHPVRGAGGTVVGMHVFAVEVTEQRTAQARLAESEDHYRHSVELNPQVPWTADAQGRMQTVSDRWLRLTGLTREESLSDARFHRRHPDEREALVQAWQHSVETGEPYCAEHRSRMADGSYRWMRSRAWPRRDASGAVVRWYGCTEDIDDERAAKDALRASEARFRTLAAAVPVGIFRADATGRCHYVNEWWLALSGLSRERALGYGWADALHPDDRERVVASWREAAGAGRPFEAEYRFLRHDGGVVWVLGRAVAEPSDGPEPGYIGTIVDLTERRRAEDAMREADRRKDEFIAVLSHELRNPLAPMRNALALLAREPLSPRGGQALQVGERQVGRLARLIDDLLEVSRITRGKIALRREPMRLQETVRDVVDGLADAFRARDQLLSLDLPETPVLLVADPVRVAQIVENLLTNAGKYTDRGGRIEVAVRADDAGVTLEVRDTGIGIAADDLPRLFEPFSQIDASVERSHGGLGIGLALVRQLAEMHGGRVGVSSGGRGRGATFGVWLPRGGEAANTT
jgi:PAS domain S-box-containing protein